VGAAQLTGSFRDAPTSDLTGRTEIWAYTTAIVLDTSPWRGLGYGVASRTLVADLDPELGSAHSVFVDVFLGGGFIALAAFVLLNALMGVDSVRILLRQRDAHAFAIAALFATVLLLSTVGAELDAAPFGFTFFCLTWMLPYVRTTEPSMKPLFSNISTTIVKRQARPQVPPPSLQATPSGDAESAEI
jgi:O-antigen ligase